MTYIFLKQQQQQKTPAQIELLFNCSKEGFVKSFALIYPLADPIHQYLTLHSHSIPWRNLDELPSARLWEGSPGESTLCLGIPGHSRAASFWCHSWLSCKSLAFSLQIALMKADNHLILFSIPKGQGSLSPQIETNKRYKLSRNREDCFLKEAIPRIHVAGCQFSITFLECGEDVHIFFTLEHLTFSPCKLYPVSWLSSASCSHLTWLLYLSYVRISHLDCFPDSASVLSYKSCTQFLSIPLPKHGTNIA